MLTKRVTMATPFHTPIYAYVILIFIITSFIYKTFFKKNRRHERNKKTSKKVLEKISSFENDGQKIAYLRKIDPFVFEELILDSFAKKGYKVIRNKRYTGDGGIDGKVIIDGDVCLIQAKRYKGLINPKHVREFEELCKKSNVSGFFCHTGRTSKNLMSEIKKTSYTVLVSGDRLIELITHSAK